MILVCGPLVDGIREEMQGHEHTSGSLREVVAATLRHESGFLFLSPAPKEFGLVLLILRGFAADFAVLGDTLGSDGSLRMTAEQAGARFLRLEELRALQASKLRRDDVSSSPDLADMIQLGASLETAPTQTASPRALDERPEEVPE